MQLRGVRPGGPFLLFLIGAILFLLHGELGADGDEGIGAAPQDWVLVRIAETAPTFYSFPAGQVLGELAERAFPRLSARLAAGCRDLKLEAGTEIFLGAAEASGEQGCLVAPLPERSRYLMGIPLNVNRSGVEDLEMLAGIGPSLAERIVAVRMRNGPFSTAEDLTSVPGISRSLVEKIKGRICFSM